MIVFNTLQEFAAAEGTEIGVGDWFEIDQARIDLFADATDDHQWIHTDPERARAELGTGAIAHGFLILALIPKFKYEIFEIKSAKRALNYGSNKIRFLNMVPAGARVRARMALKRAELDGDKLRSIANITIEIEGEEKPALVAETITLFLT
jgi:acyl dehydratase